MIPLHYLTEREKKKVNSIKQKVAKAKTREEVKAYKEQLLMFLERAYERYLNKQKNK